MLNQLSQKYELFRFLHSYTFITAAMLHVNFLCNLQQKTNTKTRALKPSQIITFRYNIVCENALLGGLLREKLRLIVECFI